MLWRGRRKPKTRQELGRIAEDHAGRYLRSKGYRILERNYRIPRGEIDIIAEHRDSLVFVEVKSRTSTEDFDPRDSVTPGKQHRIMLAAAAYLRNRDRVTRFDVVEVAITPEGRVEKIDVIEGAFQSSR
ncbi:MAG TPA: YraN family protein [Armatimonadota bacterium]|nr:YraN family protein [Armatimonadota bacterium]